MTTTAREPGRARFLALSEWSIDHPRAVLACFAALVLAAAPGLLRLELRLDGRALAPPHHPAVAADAAMRETFGLADPIVVFVESLAPEGILRPSTLARVRDLTVAIYRYEEIERRHIMSLASEGRDRVESLDFSPFLFPLPEAPAELAALKADLEAAPIQLGTLVAKDYSGAVILVQVPAGMDRLELYRRIQASVEEVGEGDDRVHVVGAPVAEVLLGQHLLADLGRLLPLCLGLLALGLALVFRRPWAVVLVLAEIAACLVFTFGFLGWVGQPIYLTTSILPVILATLALTDEIHLLVATQRRIADGQAADGRELARGVVGELVRPVFLTSLTTAIGFLSFLASDLVPVRSFGLWAAVGVSFCMVWSLSFTPVALRLLGPARLAGREGRRLVAIRLVPGIERCARARSTPYLLAGLLLVASLGVARLAIQDGWISGFAPGSAFRGSVERVNRAILGTHLLQLHLDLRAGAARDPLPLRDPALIRAIGELEAELRAVPGVGGVLGPASHLATTRFLASGRLPGTREPPETADEARRMWRRLELGRGPHRRQEVVTDAMDQALVTVFLKDANYRETARLMATAERLVVEKLGPFGARFSFAGDVAVSQAMISSIVGGQLRSVALALAGIFGLLWLVLRQVKPALFAMVPVTAACLASLGLMGWLGVPLGVATSMFNAITIGVGVDFALHLLERLRLEREAGNPTPVAAARAIVGPAILADVFAVVLGFGLLGFSQVPSNARLGFLVAASIFVAGCVTLLAARDRRQESPPPGS